MFDPTPRTRPSAVRVWSVGALLRGIADALEARFNPIAVQGEVSGFSRATSGHCYFTLKDEQGQVRCAMFRRAAQLADFSPRDGQKVEVRGRLGVYEPRGELQLIVESIRQAGDGDWFERFVRLKAQLQTEGLFDEDRKRPLPVLPRAIGVVTSLGAAAWHDVMTTLQRRVPHLPVVLYPASVQGAQAPAELQRALRQAFDRREVDVLLLVRGGGAMEDLWAFNDEALARLIVQSPMPVVCGVGHETDFTIADFCADLRAPTPTAAAELCAQPQSVWLGALDLLADRLSEGLQRRLEQNVQRVDRAAARLGQPSHLVTRERAMLDVQAQRLRHALGNAVQARGHALSRLQRDLPRAVSSTLASQQRAVQQAQTRLELLDPSLVLKRGYAWLENAQGQAITRVGQSEAGQTVRARLADGALELTVNPRA